MLDAFSTQGPDAAFLRGENLGGIASSHPARAAAGGSPSDERGPAVHSFVGNAIQRLEELVEEETAALKSGAKIDLRDFNNRKSHGLLELSRAMRHYDGVAVDGTIRTRLGSLRAKLEANRAVLKMHLEAVREISTILSDAIRDAESDGTYSQSIRPSQQRP